jgi:hypothetical protein
LNPARRTIVRRDALSEILKLAASVGRYRGTREELVPLWTDPPVVIPLAVNITKLLLAPENAARLSETAVARPSPDAEGDPSAARMAAFRLRAATR